MPAHVDIQSRPLKLSDSIPESQWQRPRREYILEGKPLSQLAKEHFLDYRTVRRLIQENADWDDYCNHPSILDPYKPRIKTLLMSGCFRLSDGITIVSMKIHEILLDEGYCGSERTVRNYIRQIKDSAVIRNEDEPAPVQSDDAE